MSWLTANSAKTIKEGRSNHDVSCAPSSFARHVDSPVGLVETFRGTNSDARYLFIQLRREIIYSAGRIETWYGTQQCRNICPQLLFHDCGQIQFVLGVRHEVLSEDGGHEELCRRDDSVGSEGLDHQQLVHGRSDGAEGFLLSPESGHALLRRALLQPRSEFGHFFYVLQESLEGGQAGKKAKLVQET